MDSKDRDKIDDAINESQSDFEKNLVYLSAGALTLSIGFIEKIISLEKALSNWLLIASWIFLAITLLLNLASHLISVRNGTKAREEMDTGTDYDKLILKIYSRNRNMRILNWVTYGLFSIGVILTVIFCSINLSSMAKQNKKTTLESVKIELGRQTPIPQNTSAATKPKEIKDGKAK